MRLEQTLSVPSESDISYGMLTDGKAKKKSAKKMKSADGTMARGYQNHVLQLLTAPSTIIKVVITDPTKMVKAGNMTRLLSQS